MTPRAWPRARRARAAARRPGSGGGRRGGAPERRARRARAQPATRVRLARAGRGARRGGAHRVAPASVPAGVRDRRVLHAGRRVHALPRAQHAAGRAANCRGSRPRRSPTEPRSRCGSGGCVEQADAVIVPSRFARERLRELGAPLDWARVHVLAPPLRALAAPAPQAPAPAGSYALSSRACRRRRASTSRSTRLVRPASRW